MVSSEPGGLYVEAGGRIQVTDECSNTGKIMGIESRGGRALFCWDLGMDLGDKGEAPELSTSGFLPTTEDDRVILGGNSDCFFFKEDAAVMVAQFANSHQVLMEVRHYVASLDGELQEEQVT